MLALTKGWDRDQVRQIVRETLLETIEPIMYAEALELMEAHRAAGHRVYLVSASPEEIVLPLAELLGVDGAICSRGRGGRRGPLHRADGLLRLRPAARPTAMRELAARTGIDLAASHRVLGLGHRSADARGGGPAGGGQPRPGTGQGGPGAGLGDAAVHQAGAPARPGRADHADGHDQPGRGRAPALIAVAGPRHRTRRRRVRWPAAGQRQLGR